MKSEQYWRQNIIHSKAEMPDFFFTKVPLLTFNLNDKHKQESQQFCILLYEKWMKKLSFSALSN